LKATGCPEQPLNMMDHPILIRFGILCVCLALGNCSPPPSKHVLIDEGWELSLNRRVKEKMCGKTESCRESADSALNDYMFFEREVITSFASDRDCHGIEVGTTHETNWNQSPPVKNEKGYWTLIFSSGDSKSAGQWVLRGINPPQLAGMDTPRQIAHKVCGALNGLGAQIDK
jgi:hypothetical protein